MINLKIDVTKIDKSKLFKGEKGTYLDAVLIETPENQYGNDYMIIQSVTKEERDQGIRGAILGNAKIFTKTKQQEQSQPVDLPPTELGGDNNDLPF